ncbi:hypothetical protein F5Y12DRAFT_774625, partial [Xylaria sp. FL1777]
MYSSLVGPWLVETHMRLTIIVVVVVVATTTKAHDCSGSWQHCCGHDQVPPNVMVSCINLQSVGAVSCKMWYQCLEEQLPPTLSVVLTQTD